MSELKRLALILENSLDNFRTVEMLEREAKNRMKEYNYTKELKAESLEVLNDMDNLRKQIVFDLFD